ncbi:MAG: hypothetical protein WBG14_04760, partial [Rhodococcus sp. (in: high G+C Gram-positive bacteria)]
MRFLAAGLMLCVLLVGCTIGTAEDGGETADTANSDVDTVRTSSAPPTPVEVPVGDVGTMFVSTSDLVR